MVAPTLESEHDLAMPEAPNAGITAASPTFEKLQSRRRSGSIWRVAGPAAIVIALAAGGLFLYQINHSGAAKTSVPNSPATPAPVAQEAAPPAPVARPAPPAMAAIPATPATSPVVTRHEPIRLAARDERPVAHRRARAATSASEDVNAYTTTPPAASTGPAAAPEPTPTPSAPVNPVPPAPPVQSAPVAPPSVSPAS